MAKIIIAFASMSGNTEEMADLIAEGVRSTGIEPVVKNVLDASGSELEGYDGILLGSYTWGDGDLPDDILDFYEELDDVELSGKKSAAFGSGDTSYAVFGGAVLTLEAKLKERGADNIQENLIIELNPSGDEKEVCRNFGKQFASTFVATR